MWVSTGMAGRPSEKQRMMAAVLGPMPLKRLSQSFASSRGISARNDRSNEPTSSRTSFSTCLMRGALTRNSPARRIAFSICFTSAAAMASKLPNVSMRLVKARSELMSDVCCERMV